MEATTNPYTEIEKGKGIKVAEHLAAQGVDLVLIREAFHGKGPEYVFTSRDIRVIQTQAEVIDTELIARLYREETGQELAKS